MTSTGILLAIFSAGNPQPCVDQVISRAQLVAMKRQLQLTAQWACAIENKRMNEAQIDCIDMSNLVWHTAARDKGAVQWSVEPCACARLGNVFLVIS